ncbi:MAG TPA: phenylalanine--tRNA ligase subunit alpha [Pyrinomonadaceae bacterium]|nr:phenylalanine--tRNA ligase subunit alpha [Chloracidobacterium sp.]MBP9936190.1 phenylalanine--tRNA ligase subunit alpha [Pyrinomonadaceae bacterium]MBK9439571.1 phenylalanine--tRNA ligase subunit alpha [Chloracidobacterium sp.]MBL0239141.1 phenylalanine--tRNA ligase subunit alpha [Chloracidobacterium sp.]HQX56210.1 phenylalanine--tRNA ligase subunit alpha [Pyrinomonadaceae bacterium]
MSEVREKVDEVKNAFFDEFERFRELDLSSASLASGEELSRDLAELKIRHTGKKSAIAGTMKLIGQVAPEERGAFGQMVQSVEKEIVSSIEAAETTLNEFIVNARIERERLDVTLPGRRPRTGHLHLITILREKIEDIFVSMGYAIEDDREIETDYYNFDALNIPEGHPARESQDTFYTTQGFALRSQTSTVQIRAMERRGVPIRIIAPGKVFRRDTPDMTHVPMFHQIEGLCVDKGITMAHLKGTVTEWLQRLFGDDTVTRFRPSYFPFTEPSAEFDFSCFKCHGTGKFGNDRCRPCKGSGWIELGGSGMVHPNVLKAVGVDPEVYSGFAFGFGLERMCSMMYSLDDIRLMFDNDVRFLEQFR